MAYLLSSSTGNMCDGEGFSATMAGSANYITTANITQLSNVATMSLSFWGKKTAGADIVVCGKNGASGDSWYLRVDNGTLVVYMSRGASGSSGSYTISNDTNLHHYVFTYDGGGATNADKLKLYIDGTNQTLTFSGTIPSTTTSNTGVFRIGYAADGSAYGTNGTISQVDLYTTTISSSDVSTLYNSGSGRTDGRIVSGHLVGWRFREGAGSTAWAYGTAASSYGGTYTGTVTRSTGLIYDNTSRRWALCNSAVTMDSEAGTTTLTTSQLNSSSAAGISAGTVIDGIAVKVATVATSPTGTMTLHLRNTSDSVNERTVTIDVADLSKQTGSTTSKGWAFFKFNSSYTTVSGKGYAVGLLTSSSSQVSCYTNGTANNWSRLFRTTATQSPAIADNLVFCGELTGQGTGNDITITGNNIEAVKWGTSSAVATNLHIGYRGKLAAPVSGGVDYYFGFVCASTTALEVAAGGTLQLGTSGAKIQSGTTFQMPCFNSTNVDGGVNFLNGCTYVGGFYDKTIATRLTSTASSGATSIVVDDATGWLTGDQIVIDTSTRTYSQAEIRTITSVSGTTIGVAALTNTHTALSFGGAKLLVMNVTRPAKIYGTSSSLGTFVNFGNYPYSVSGDGFELYYAGSATTDKRGFDYKIIATGDGNSATLDRMSVHDCTVSSASPLITTTTSNNYTLSNFTIYNVASGVTITATSGANYTINNLYVVSLSSGVGITISDIGGVFSGTIHSSAAQSTGIAISETAQASATSWGTFEANGNSGAGITLTGRGVTFAGITSFRNTGAGVTLTNTHRTRLGAVNLFGNTTNNLLTSGSSSGISIDSGYSSGDTAFATTNGINISTAGCYPEWSINNLVFSTTSGIGAVHTNDINVSSGQFVSLAMNKCKLDGTNEIASLTNLIQGSVIGSQDHDQTAGNHKFWMANGIGTYDSAIYASGSESLRFTPSGTSFRSIVDSRCVPIASGSTKTVSVKVRLSVSGDGAAYNGVYPRLILRANPSLGSSWNTDTVLDTATSAASGAFETLTATTPTAGQNGAFEVYVDCDGTTGWINVDDWSVT